MLIKLKYGYINDINRKTTTLKDYNNFSIIGNVIYVPNNFKGNSRFVNTYVDGFFMISGTIDDKFNYKYSVFHLSDSEPEIKNEHSSILKYLKEYIDLNSTIREELAVKRMEMLIGSSLIPRQIQIQKFDVKKKDFKLDGFMTMKDLIEAKTYNGVYFNVYGRYLQNQAVIDSVSFTTDMSDDKRFMENEEKYKEEITKYVYLPSIIDIVNDKFKENNDED